jgi:hypothetical protein
MQRELRGRKVQTWLVVDAMQQQPTKVGDHRFPPSHVAD